MHRHDYVRNLDTPLVCARKHQQMTMKCTYSSVKLLKLSLEAKTCR